MKTYQANSPGMIYRDQLNDLIEIAPEVVVRGKRTRELLDVATILEPPIRRWGVIVPGRRLNPWLALSECLWVLAGREDIKVLEPYNKRIRDFSDNGVVLYGAYGRRIFGQINGAIQRLRDDPNDRRVVLSIWRPSDLFAVTKDPPCNDMVLFKLRQKQLHMTVINRSNDLHWGLHAVNLFEFGMLQDYIAARLGASAGTQTHLSNSLHIYTEGPGQKITERMLAASDRPLHEYGPASRPFADPLPSHSKFARECGKVLERAADAIYDPYQGYPFLEFAFDFLMYYRWLKVDSKEWASPPIRHANRFTDWWDAVEEWMR